MKLRILLVCIGMIVSALAASASDIIALIDGTTIEGRVEEVTATVIKYRKASNPTGPIYSVETAMVRNVLYENGSVDSFNNQAPVQNTQAQTTPSVPAQQQTTQPQAASQQNQFTYDYQSSPMGTLSDRDLLRMAETDNILLKKAKRCRLIGWIGAGVIFGGVMVLSQVFPKGNCEYASDASNLLMFGGIGLGAAGVWALGWNLAAHHYMKQYRALEYSTANIIQQDILQFGANKLTAGVNVMGSRLTHNQSYGLSLALSF